jgi:hypothetical protein
MLTGQARREARQQAQEAAGELLRAGRPGAVRATQVTRQVIALAFEAGLNPELDPQVRHGAHRVLLDSRSGDDCLFGGIDIGARTGSILRAYLTRSRWGEERRYEHVAEIRDAVKAWARTSGETR